MLVALLNQIICMKAFLFFLFTSLSLVSQAEGIVFQKIGFEEAKALALKSKKGLFVDVYIDGCAPCKYMCDRVFNDIELGNYMNSHFISIQINPSLSENRSIKSKFNITCYPTLLCFDVNGKLIRKIEGSKEINELKEIVKNVISPEESPLYKMNQEYKKGNKENAFLRLYIQTLKENDSSVTLITREFINLYSLNLESNLDLKLLCDAEFLSDNKYMILIFENIARYNIKEPVIIKKLVKQLIERTIDVAVVKRDYSIVEKFSSSIFKVYLTVINPAATSESIQKEFKYKYENRLIQKNDNWIVKPGILN